MLSNQTQRSSNRIFYVILGIYITLNSSTNLEDFIQLIIVAEVKDVNTVHSAAKSDVMHVIITLEI
jgi:hypothetical protein